MDNSFPKIPPALLLQDRGGNWLRRNGAVMRGCTGRRGVRALGTGAVLMVWLFAACAGCPDGGEHKHALSDWHGVSGTLAATRTAMMQQCQTGAIESLEEGTCTDGASILRVMTKTSTIMWFWSVSGSLEAIRTGEPVMQSCGSDLYGGGPSCTAPYVWGSGSPCPPSAGVSDAGACPDSGCPAAE